jgi:coenzyme F420-0:L-glutamate ligase / coenzyme F420-1:gamma-L-glutamate ligase
MAGIATLELWAVPDVPLIRPGDDLGSLIGDALDRAELRPQQDDIVVVAQKIVSKAEGRYVDLAAVDPSPKALRLGADVGKDPRLVQVILSESVRLVRKRSNLLIMQHRLGFVMASAGVDHSNLDHGPGTERVLLLPADPDASAAGLRSQLEARFDTALGVVINDSFGRPWRRGVVGVAIGVAGLPSLVDLRGKPDLSGRPLEVTVLGLADEVAAAASLIMGQADEGRPIALVRGVRATAPDAPASALVRPEAEDLFR